MRVSDIIAAHSLKSRWLTELLVTDYITAEIEGDEEHRRQTLKLGALWAVSIVSGLYISFNLLLVSLRGQHLNRSSLDTN